MIVIHLDTLDVVANALATPIPAAVKEETNLFANAIAPVLLAHVNEEPLPITLGLLGLILDRSDVRTVSRTKVGLLLLTMLISRAELLKEAAGAAGAPPMTPEDQLAWQQYATLYGALFAAVEPVLPRLFPEANPLAADDVHVWQFLAAMGVAASAEQQQRLVLGVKDRVMGSVTAARTLPAGEQERRLGEVNLFMRALGLDVELLA
jgi:DNA topoisomerase 2-associated protein PAT1